jgi:hypothetical protein
MSHQPPPSVEDTPPAEPAWFSNECWVALAAGLFMGAVVLGISNFHEGSSLGLGLALVYVLSAAASTVLFLLCLPGSAELVGRARSARVHAWLVAQGLGVLASLQLLPALS